LTESLAVERHLSFFRKTFYLKIFLYGLAPISNEGGSYTLSPAGRTAYVLSLPKHAQMGQNLMKIFRCRQQRKKAPQFGFIVTVIADTTRNLFHQLVLVAVII
jgi:hypothetical protein